jgi:hypothetical protein
MGVIDQARTGSSRRADPGAEDFEVMCHDEVGPRALCESRECVRRCKVRTGSLEE